MNIIDLSPAHEKTYFCCLEEWSEEMKEAGNHKETWYGKMKDRGLRVKLAEDDDGAIAGMIQYLPIEHAQFEGKDLYVILCIWVHRPKLGVGNRQKKGLGTALLKAAEEDVRQLGGKGMAAWGIILPAFMRASWFRRHGYKGVDRDGLMKLLWKPFSPEAQPPRFIRLKKKPERTEGKVNVAVFYNGWCPVGNLMYERAKKASEEFPGKVAFTGCLTTEKTVIDEWGISDALFIEGKKVRTGPPPSYDKIRNRIAKRVKGLRN